MGILEFIQRINGLVSELLTALKYAVKKFITWWVRRKAHSEEERNLASEALVKSIGAFIVVLIIAAINIFLGDKDEVMDDFIPIQVEPMTNPDKRILVKDKVIGGASYTGYYNTDIEKPDGEGIMLYSNGGKYDGYWEAGIQQGQGIMKYNNGDIYDGSWENGMKCGHGIYTWKDGRKYDGHYKNDMRDGQGTYSGWTGFEEKYGYGWKGTYVGVNKDDKFEGQGNFYFDNGGEFEGIFFDNGLWSGKYKKDGNTYNVVDGKILF